MMCSKKWLACALLIACVSVRQVMPAPAPQEDEPEEKWPPRPYNYHYEVEEAKKKLYFGANESGDEAGKVVGGYYVLHPDGRLMSVEYTVEGKSGFVPVIRFVPNANPFGTEKQ